MDLSNKNSMIKCRGTLFLLLWAACLEQDFKTGGKVGQVSVGWLFFANQLLYAIILIPYDKHQDSWVKVFTLCWMLLYICFCAHVALIRVNIWLLFYLGSPLSLHTMRHHCSNPQTIGPLLSPVWQPAGQFSKYPMFFSPAVLSGTSCLSRTSCMMSDTTTWWFVSSSFSSLDRLPVAKQLQLLDSLHGINLQYQ